MTRAESKPQALVWDNRFAALWTAAIIAKRLQQTMQRNNDVMRIAPPRRRYIHNNITKAVRLFFPAEAPMQIHAQAERFLEIAIIGQRLQ